jgi:general secretion pathway protein D
VKKIIILQLLSLSFLLSLTARAATLGTACGELEKCVESVGKLTGKKYFYTQKLKGGAHSTSNLELTPDNADRLLSHVLNQAGYTRIKRDDLGGFTIINARDVRYNPVPQVSKLADLPDVSDYYMFDYKVKHAENTNQISRSLRPFMSRYGRIIAVKYPGKLIIQDTAINLRRLVKLIDRMDVKLSKSARNRLKLEDKRRHEIRLKEAAAKKETKIVEKK